MRLRLLLTISVLTVLSCSSCTVKTSLISEKLDKVESLLTSEPDSALLLIEGIDLETIHKEKIKARHALLYSIIMDKRHVDIKSDSLIRPALEYYPRHGDCQETAMMFYYTARIYENADDLELAMKYLVKAESIRSNKDPYLNSLIHSAKGRIYNHLHEYAMAAEEYGKSASYCNGDENYGRYVSNKIREATCRYMQNDYSSTQKILDALSIDKFQLSNNVLGKYYQLAINLADTGNDERLEELIEEYKETISQESIDWVLIARVESERGDTESAAEAISLHYKHRGKDISYHALNSKILEAQGLYKEALEEYKIYDSLSGIIGNQIIDQDTKFVEEREHHNEMHEKARMKSTILLLTCVVILLSLCLTICMVIAVRRQLQLKKHEQAELARQVDELLTEREELSRLNTVSEEARKIIAERLRIIDNFVFSDVLQDEIFERKASETLSGIISNREEFIRQNRLIFNESHPRFTNYLLEMGLTEKEIEHCCLYAIGLNGKMATTFTNLKRHYHVGSSIRKKLGLNGHDTNISIHIKRLFKELEESQNEYIGLPTCLKDGR